MNENDSSWYKISQLDIPIKCEYEIFDCDITKYNSGYTNYDEYPEEEIFSSYNNYFDELESLCDLVFLQNSLD